MKKPAWSSWLLVTIISALLGAAAFVFLSPKHSDTDAKAVLEAEWRMTDGQIFDKNTLKGQVIVINFWASWCPFCKRQNHYLEKFSKRVPPGSINIVTISIDKTPEAAKEYMRLNQYTFPAAMMTKELNRAIGKIRGVPVLFIIDANNKVIYKEIGEVFEEDYAELIKYAK